MIQTMMMDPESDNESEQWEGLKTWTPHPLLLKHSTATTMFNFVHLLVD